MAQTVRIDFVSDIACPWCVVGLGGLETALRNAADVVTADLHFQPFELNPDMPPGGQNREERSKSYGMAPEKLAEMRGHIKARAAEFGFEMVNRPEGRIYNTFNAHRLLHWAGIEGRQLELKHALFAANFTRGENLEDADVLAGAAQAAGLDPDQAREVLSSGRYAEEVRAAENQWRAAGITSVPAVIINEKYLISGGQPVEVFEQALREISQQG